MTDESRFPTALLVGYDSEAGQHWAWRWADGDGWGPLHHVDADDARRVRSLLASAIPGLARRRAEPGERMSLGWLAHPDTEAKLASLLGGILLPPALCAGLIERSQDAGGPIQLRLHPSPSTAMVPWETLVVDSHAAVPVRLLDVADVVQVAPLLRRDGVSGVRPRGVEGPPLLVVDPSAAVGHVLTEAARATWQADVRARGEGAVGSVFGARYDRRLLARYLPGRSRFVFVGHVTATSADPRTTGLVLGCRPMLYATGPADGLRHRSLTAFDLTVGTRGIEATRVDRVGFRARFGIPDVTEDVVPEAAWDVSERRPLEVDGPDLWPMPPRVGLVGCRSGPDLAHPEPSGLVTAVLAAGAELVIATRWTLYTARTFAAAGAHVEPLADAARAVDLSLATPSPGRSLADWQRGQLERWRHDGDLGSSPLTWGALALTDGTPRVTSRHATIPTS